MRSTSSTRRPQNDRFAATTLDCSAVGLLGALAGAGLTGVGLTDLGALDGAGRTPDESDSGEADDEERAGAGTGAGDGRGGVGADGATGVAGAVSAAFAKGRKPLNSETTLRL